MLCLKVVGNCKIGGMPMNDLPKTIKDLNLEDDFLFAKVMADNEICRRVLEQILNISIKKVVSPTTQKTIDLLLDGKGIRLDLYVNDDKDTVYNFEMQRTKRKDLPKRARYYQGNIDLDLISAGRPYDDLRRTYIIFICTFDFFNQGRHIYTFENICKEDNKINLGDETVKIFLNAKGVLDDVSSDIKEFLQYIETTTAEFAERASNSLIKDIQKKVEEVKENKEMEVEYMTLFQRDRENRELGLKEGIELGREEGYENSTKILKLHNKGVNKQEISLRLNLNLDIVEKIIRNYESI